MRTQPLNLARKFSAALPRVAFTSTTRGMQRHDAPPPACSRRGNEADLGNETRMARMDANSKSSESTLRIANGPSSAAADVEQNHGRFVPPRANRRAASGDRSRSVRNQNAARQPPGGASVRASRFVRSLSAVLWSPLSVPNAAQPDPALAGAPVNKFLNINRDAIGSARHNRASGSCSGNVPSGVRNRPQPGTEASGRTVGDKVSCVNLPECFDQLHDRNFKLSAFPGGPDSQPPG